MKKSLIPFSIAGFSLMPLIARAADACPTTPPTTPGNLKDLVCKIMELVNPLIGLLTGLAVLYFIWHIVQFIAKAGDEKGRAAAKDGILYGVIGLFVLFSFWGIVELLRASVFN